MSGPRVLTSLRAAVTVSAVAIALALGGCTGPTVTAGGASPTPSPPAPSATPTPAPSPPLSPSPSPSPSASPSASPSPSAPVEQLRAGDRGAAVLALQKELQRLGYWVAAPDGVYGDATSQAVLALQKAAGLPRDGIAGPRTLAALDAETRPTPRSREGAVVEVDLKRQLVMLVADGSLRWTFNTSTGGGYAYVSGGTQKRALTPTGSYSVYRQIDGMRVAELGKLWRPKYFNGGIAIHGAASVPAQPVSHGCVRLSMAAMDWVWASGAIPVGTKVLVY